jgi:hypothetical protein
MYKYKRLLAQLKAGRAYKTILLHLKLKRVCKAIFMNQLIIVKIDY